MSDALTDIYRNNRKLGYLDSIELKKDKLFDQYRSYTKELIELSERLSNTIFYNDKIVIEKILIIKIKIEELDKIINLLDVEYKEIDAKELKEF